MANKLNAFQMYEPKYFSGQVSDTFFSSLWQRKPQMASNIIRQVLSRNTNSYASYLSKFSTLKIEDHEEEFSWKMIASTYRNIPLVEARVGGSTITSATTNVGILGTQYTLVFGERWFNEGEIIVGELNEIYRSRIIGEPVPEGTNFAYTCEVTGDNHNSGIPGSELIAGKKFSWEYATIELEEHDDVGGLRFSSALEMKQSVSAIRKSYKIAGREFGRKMMTPVRLKGSDGNLKTFTMSMPWLEWTFEQEFEREFNQLLIFGRSNRDEYGNYHDRGKSNNLIKEGGGLREQKSVGNSMIYDIFSLKTIEEALYQISAGRLDLNDRIFTLRTGERGAIQFHNAASSALNSWVPLGSYGTNAAANVAFTQKVSSPLHSNAVSIGAQIVEYRAPNNAVIRLEVDPMYDDTSRNKIMKGGSEINGPAESYRYDLDYIGSAQEPNIQLVEVKGHENGTRGYHGGPEGFNNPWLGAGKGSGSNGVDKYTCTKFRRGGVAVFDPSRCMTILPPELAAFA